MKNRKELLRKWFHQVDEGMRDLLAPNRIQVVLAGLDYVNSIDRQVNSSAELLDNAVSINPDSLSDRELHRRADGIVSDYFMKDQAKATDQDLRLWYIGCTSNSLPLILPAAYQGRVQSRFVAIGVQQWSRFDESRYETVVSDEPTAQDQGLLNLAAIQTFITGGSVYAVAPDEVPGGGNVAAVFRY